MDGQRYDIRAQVYTLGGYSAHADQNGLVRFVTLMRRCPSEVRICMMNEVPRRFRSKL
ncbi:MBL fold metallo-hydrolase RNA specificity domain-containing protein [Ectopseudomonas mendocina]|jgi:metallo-beta-lactamase family protein|uniref:MBL fold metallo-hydrolase RNA specificity domain-containing protein n=1 Tax=Ectopseudomonas mendocina TaxID=300 RepID=UPI003CC9A620